MSDIFKEMDMTPDTTIAEICSFALQAMVADGMNSFDFDIHGIAPDGSPVILHFEAKLQMTGKA